MKKVFLSILLFIITQIVFSQISSVSSPDGMLKLDIFLEEGHPYYSVIYDGKTILEKSPLGIITNEGDFSKDLIYKIFNTYLKQDILHKNKGDIEGFAKELRNSYAKADETFFGWCQDEKEVLPSSIIHHEIDKKCKNYNIAIPNESKRSIFFYIANRADIKLNNGAAQSTIIQQLVDIPDVVEAVNKLGISNDCHLKYDFYCFLAENIYNDLLKNEQKVNFFKIKDAIKIIIEKKAQEENNKTKDNIFYPKYAFNL